MDKDANKKSKKRQVQHVDLKTMPFDNLEKTKCKTDLNSMMHLKHELKQFVDHSFQELPVSPNKSWILTNNISKKEVTNQLSHIFLLLDT
jgi:hypothetical protein